MFEFVLKKINNAVVQVSRSGGHQMENPTTYGLKKWYPRPSTVRMKFGAVESVRTSLANSGPVE